MSGYDFSLTLWVVRAGEKGEEEEEAIKNNIVTIGWNNLENLSEYTDFDSLYEYYKRAHPREEHDRPTDYDKSSRLQCGEVWAFLRKINIGDFVVLPRKITDDILIGKVLGNYEYEQYTENIKHTRPVKWIKKINRNNIPEEILSSMNTGLTVFRVEKNDAENYVRKVAGDETKIDKFEEGEQIVSNYLLEKTGVKFTGFDHPTLVEEVEYKQKIRENSLKHLELNSWNQWKSSPGKIIDAVKKACSVSGNLLEHRYGPDTNSDAPLYLIEKTDEFEKILYDFFLAGNSEPEQVQIRFDRLVDFVYENSKKRSWRFFSFLLFLLDDSRYFPITPTNFDICLQFYGITEKLTRERKSWAKYSLVFDLIEELKPKLSSKYGTLSNLQIHAYLWVLIQGILKSSRESSGKSIQEIIDFIENVMQPVENYQPVVIKTLAENGGTASKQIIENSLKNYNPESDSLSMLQTVTKVLKDHSIIRSEGNNILLNIAGVLDEDDSEDLIKACDIALEDFKRKKSKKIAICWPTDQDENKIEDFAKIIKENGKVLWGVNWKLSQVKKTDFPITGYLYYRQNIIGISKISDFTSHDVTSTEDLKLRPMEWKDGSNSTHYIHMENIKRCEPFSHKKLKLMDSTKEIPDVIQQRVYVQELGEENTQFNCWIWSVTPENWEIVKEQNIWASKIGQKIRDKVRPGDKVIFYVLGTHEFQGIFEFIEEWYDATKPVWSEEKDSVIYQSQIKLRPIKIGSVNVYDVAHELKMFPNPDDKRLINLVLKGAGGYPSNNGKPIVYEDYERLLELMENYYIITQNEGSRYNDIPGVQYGYDNDKAHYKNFLEGTNFIVQSKIDSQNYFVGYGKVGNLKKSPGVSPKGKPIKDIVAKFSEYHELPEKKIRREEINEKMLRLAFPKGGRNIPPAMLQITKELYDEIVNGKEMKATTIEEQQVTLLPETHPVTPDKLRIPTEDEVKKGIQEIQKELLIEDSIIEEIVTHLASGRHILLAGPVGTGKTRLSQLIPGAFWTENSGYFADIRTATADWTTQDVIGGISPKILEDSSEPTYEIENGCVTDTILANYEESTRDSDKPLRHTSIHIVEDEKKEFNGTWLVIDEFNRADIDKAFGQLFTALEYKRLILQNVKSGQSTRTIPIPEDYRIIGTLNTADKHYLFNLSDALKRRFAYVEIPIPKRTEENKKREIFLAIKNGLKELDSEKFIDIIKINPDNDTLAYYSDTAQKNIEYSFNVLELVREFKPLGTAILKSIYQTLLVSEKMGNSKSVDNAINANLIPQLETLPKPNLRILYEYIFGNLEDFLQKETHKEQFKIGFEAVLRYLNYSEKEIEPIIVEFINGRIPEKLGTKIVEMKKNNTISFPESSLFKTSLEEILKQSEF